MRLLSGRVINGKIVVEGDPLPEGGSVTVFCHEGDSFEVGPEEEAILLERIGQADAGRLVDAEDVVRGISSRN